MAKAGNTSRRAFNRYASTSHKPRPSGNKANAAGYAKRQAKKAKTPQSLSASDVYEFAPEATRRAKIKLDLDPDEAREYGVGLDGDNSDDGRREMSRARLIGENVENEMIDSEDDEEIDSDDAFDESDEDRFAGFFSSRNKEKTKTKKKLQRLPEVDLNEDDVDMDDDAASQNSDADAEEEDEEDMDGEDVVDILDVLDGKAKLDSESDDEGTPKAAKSSTPLAKGHDPEEEEDAEDDFRPPSEKDVKGVAREDSEEEDEEDDDVEEAGEDHAILASDEEEAPGALDELQNFISTLDPSSKKRKAPEGEDSGTGPGSAQDRRKQRRILLKERTEAGVENEFRVPNSGAKLQLDDLLAPLASSSISLQSLKNSTKPLKPSATSKSKTLSAPLPQRAQERLDRQAAYEQTKEEVDKWSETMKRIREAEHISFPLQAQPTGRVSNLELAAKFKPSTELESSIDALLKSAKLRDQDILHTEDSMLAANQLSVEEVQQRRAELRKMRDLMFRAEIKARRVAKIKSKAYRKIKRKQREKLGNMDGDGDVVESDSEEARMKREKERARERATLRHKHTGKWAKQMKAKDMFDEDDGRQDIEEMLDRGEKLRRRIKGVESDEEEGGDSGGSEDEDEDVDAIKARAFEELRQVNNEEVEESSEGKKGVFQMKFMKDAMARKQHETDKMVDDFVRELGEMDDERGELQEANPESGTLSIRTGGRVAYHPGAAQQPTHIRLTAVASDTSSVTLKSTDLLSPPPVSPDERVQILLPIPETTSTNPWLSRDAALSTGSKLTRKSNDVVVSKDSNTMTKSKNKMKKMARKLEEEKQKRKDDAVVEISEDNLLILEGSSTTKSTAASGPAKKRATRVATPDDEDDDGGSEVEVQERALQAKDSKGAGVKAFEQRDLVALAFAGDNVVQQFEEAKKREIAADAPKEVDTTLAGWGSWGGVGVQKAPTKARNIKKVAGIDPTTRADYGKANVIISERRDKKASKYLVKDLPYPYTSKAQFERTMETPLGREWNTRLAFQRGTLPRVTKKPGMVINPLEKLNS